MVKHAYQPSFMVTTQTAGAASGVDVAAAEDEGQFNPYIRLPPRAQRVAIGAVGVANSFIWAAICPFVNHIICV